MTELLLFFKKKVPSPIETRDLVLKESEDLKRGLLQIVKNMPVSFFPDLSP
jgi:hypothetical protein